MKITKNMDIYEIIEKYPETVGIFIKYGINCLTCVTARYDSIEEYALVHKIDVASLFEELNAIVN